MEMIVIVDESFGTTGQGYHLTRIHHLDEHTVRVHIPSATSTHPTHPTPHLLTTTPRPATGARRPPAPPPRRSRPPTPSPPPPGGAPAAPPPCCASDHRQRLPGSAARPTPITDGGRLADRPAAAASAPTTARVTSL